MKKNIAHKGLKKPPSLIKQAMSCLQSAYSGGLDFRNPLSRRDRRLSFFLSCVAVALLGTPQEEDKFYDACMSFALWIQEGEKGAGK